MSIVFLAKGHAHLGMNKMDNNGNIVESVPARFEFAPDGPCVAVGELDPETMEAKGDADIYGDWDAAGYLAKAMELLKPSRKLNIPDFKAIVKSLWEEDHIDLCDHCRDFHDCSACIVNTWKAEDEE